MDFLVGQAKSLNDPTLRMQTLDAISNVNTCVMHRANLTDAAKNTILTSLKNQGLVRTSDDATFPGGLKAGVFPPLVNDGTKCPQLPQPFYSAPGSVFHGHHSYPGGLPVHESNNDVADVHLAAEYRSVYGRSEAGGLPAIQQNSGEGSDKGDFFIDQDIIVGAPIWHDWGKPIVFQWNGDGSEFQELNFGGNGSTDNFGAAGDSTTGGHHIIGIAEAMKRGLSPAFVITQASAHSAPTSGNEFKVVNWLRAAAIMAQIDPVAAGYLTKDSAGHFRLPALRQLGQINFLATSPSQTNILAEYELHNLSGGFYLQRSRDHHGRSRAGEACTRIWFLAGPNQLQPGLSQSRVEFTDGGATPDHLCQFRAEWRSPGTATPAQRRHHLRTGKLDQQSGRKPWPLYLICPFLLLHDGNWSP
jgi:hypothetical protein